MGFSKKEYWFEKYSEECKKLEQINSQISSLNTRKQVIEKNKQNYQKKYLDDVIGEPIFLFDEEIEDIKEDKVKNIGDLIHRSYDTIYYLKEKVKKIENENDLIKKNLVLIKTENKNLNKNQKQLKKKLNQKNSKIKSLNEKIVSLKKNEKTFSFK